MAPASWKDWNALQQTAALFASYPAIANPADPQAPFTLQSVFEIALDPAGTAAALLDRLALITGWDRAVLGDLDARFALSAVDLKPYRQIPVVSRLRTLSRWRERRPVVHRRRRGCARCRARFRDKRSSRY